MRSALFFLMLLSGSAWAQKIDASLQCRFTGTDFVYDCVVRLARGGKPLEGARFTVGADMPSMPMAHNIKPVQAAAEKHAGEYRVTLDLEMTGEWAVKLRLAAPVRDQLVLHYLFDERGAQPAVRRGAARRDAPDRAAPAR